MNGVPHAFQGILPPTIEHGFPEPTSDNNVGFALDFNLSHSPQFNTTSGDYQNNRPDLGLNDSATPGFEDNVPSTFGYFGSQFDYSNGIAQTTMPADVPATFMQTFGAFGGAATQAAPPLGQTAAPAPAGAQGTNLHVCTHPGCSKSFVRAGDFRRHLRIHGPAEFVCPVKACHREFSRLDKVRDHLRKGHKMRL